MYTLAVYGPGVAAVYTTPLAVAAWFRMLVVAMEIAPVGPAAPGVPAGP